MERPIASLPDHDRREPLWDRVDRNRTRLVGYIALFTLFSTVWMAAVLWLALGFVSLLFGGGAADPVLSTLLDGRAVVGLGGVASLAYVWWSLRREERWLLSRLGARLVPRGELLETKMAVKDMAIAAGMPVAPALYLLETNNVNAFVVHAVGRRPILGVTAGLIEQLDVAEQRAVFANLIARLCSGDTMIASAMAALLAPLHSWREYRLERLDHEDGFLAAAAERRRYGADSDWTRTSPDLGPDAVLLMLPVGFPLVLLGEVLAATYRRSQLTAAEKADAEGMLLLREPASMLSALEKCVRHDNVVVSAGEAYGELFYCWTGDSTNDEDDVEWRRVARLREVLGVEGEPVPPLAEERGSRTPLAAQDWG